MYKLLDTYAGAGGCSMGYFKAGFAPYGIDNDPLPLRHYPFPHLVMDALEALERLIAGEGLTFSNGETLYLRDFAAIHASPPCEFGSKMTAKHCLGRHQNLIPQTRDRLRAIGKPYVIENIPDNRRWLNNPLMLCGTMFGLPLWRHRYFETMPELGVPTITCNHSVVPILVTGSPRRNGNRTEPSTDQRREAMQISWMSRTELDKAIPPAYLEFVGKQLLTYLEAQQ